MNLFAPRDNRSYNDRERSFEALRARIESEAPKLIASAVTEIRADREDIDLGAMLNDHFSLDKLHFDDREDVVHVLIENDSFSAEFDIPVLNRYPAEDSRIWEAA